MYWLETFVMRLVNIRKNVGEMYSVQYSFRAIKLTLEDTIDLIESLNYICIRLCVEAYFAQKNS